jgi:hypothetical protein
LGACLRLRVGPQTLAVFEHRPHLALPWLALPGLGVQMVDKFDGNTADEPKANATGVPDGIVRWRGLKFAYRPLSASLKNATAVNHITEAG